MRKRKAAPDPPRTITVGKTSATQSSMKKCPNNRKNNSEKPYPKVSEKSHPTIRSKSGRMLKNRVASRKVFYRPVNSDMIEEINDEESSLSYYSEGESLDDESEEVWHHKVEERQKKETAPVEPSAPPPGEWLENSTIFPQGLHSFIHLDQLQVERSQAHNEGVSKRDRTKRYIVKDADGELLFTGTEESDPLARCCFGSVYSWIFHLYDNNDREVLTFKRPLRCLSCLFPCCLQKLTVHAGGTTIGSMIQRWNPIRPSYTIRNAVNEITLVVKGTSNLRFSVEKQFRIKSSDGKLKVGAIVKKCTEIASEYIKDGNSILIYFPVDLDVRMKAVLIGASFLYDHMYFDKPREHRL